MLLQNRAAQGEQPVPRDQEDVGFHQNDALGCKRMGFRQAERSHRQLLP
jgi:hypothetical protein